MDSPKWPDWLLWTGLTATASALMLAVTNHITQDIAAVPFLWVIGFCMVRPIVLRQRWYVYANRNFYGTIKVKETHAGRHRGVGDRQPGFLWPQG